MPVGNRAPAACGTEQAYRRHLRQKEQPCQACKDAHATWQRDYLNKNPDRRWHRVNPERSRKRTREWHRKHRIALAEGARLKEAMRRHGLHYQEVLAKLWTAQNGKCYLCGDVLEESNACIDHDHRCCPYGSTCSYCRRGLACNNCNTAIGMADDNPTRLRLIASNLEAARTAFEARAAAKPEQLWLDMI